MSRRRIVLAVCVLGLLGGGAGEAFAGPAGTDNHQICVVLAKTSDYSNGQYLCLDSPGQSK